MQILPCNIQKGGRNDNAILAELVPLKMYPVSLKVGSCPNNDKSVKIFFCPFLCSIYIILLSESVAAEKTAKILLKIRNFLFVYFFCVGIPILKIGLPHAHEWVAFDFIR